MNYDGPTEGPTEPPTPQITPTEPGPAFEPPVSLTQEEIDCFKDHGVENWRHQLENPLLGGSMLEVDYLDCFTDERLVYLLLSLGPAEPISEESTRCLAQSPFPRNLRLLTKLDEQKPDLNNAFAVIIAVSMDIAVCHSEEEWLHAQMPPRRNGATGMLGRIGHQQRRHNQRHDHGRCECPAPPGPPGGAGPGLSELVF